MMKRTLLLILLPVLLMGQENEMLTPMADVKFAGDRIIYYCADDPIYRLKPQYMIPGADFTIVSKDVAGEDALLQMKSTGFLKKFLTNVLPDTIQSDEKEFYIRAFTLQCIWGINDDLPPLVSSETVCKLQSDPDNSVASIAEISYNMYESIKKAKKEMDGYNSYVHEGEWLKVSENATGDSLAVELKKSPPGKECMIRISDYGRRNIRTYIEETIEASRIFSIQTSGMVEGNYSAELFQEGKPIERISFRITN